MSETTKAHCDRCGGDTNHEVLSFNASENPEYFFSTFSLLKCLGCGEISLEEHVSATREQRDGILEIRYPPRVTRKMPGWWCSKHVIPKTVAQLMLEVHLALRNHSTRLAAMGIRAVLEAVMIDKVSDRGNFKSTLDAFQAAGYIGVRHRNVVEVALEAGHASMHRAWQPNDKELNALMDIAESVIESVYLHEGQAAKLEESVPRRKPPK